MTRVGQLSWAVVDEHYEANAGLDELLLEVSLGLKKGRNGLEIGYLVERFTRTLRDALKCSKHRVCRGQSDHAEHRRKCTEAPPPFS